MMSDADLDNFFIIVVSIGFVLSFGYIFWILRK